MIAAVVVLWLGVTALVPTGEWGDRFGGVNALFSGLAFVGLIYAILLQQRELEITRQELRETREAAEEQAKALADQVEVMKWSAVGNVLASIGSIRAVLAAAQGANVRGNVADRELKSLEQVLKRIEPDLRGIGWTNEGK